MEKDDRFDRHFTKKREHTAIKHSILSDTLTISLSIANISSKKYFRQINYFHIC